MLLIQRENENNFAYLNYGTIAISIIMIDGAVYVGTNM